MKKDFDLIIFDLDGTLYPISNEMDLVYPRVAYKLLSQKTGQSLATVKEEFLIKKADLGKLIGGKPTTTLTLLYFYDIGFDDFENEIDREVAIDKHIHFDARAVETVKHIAANYSTFLYTTNNAKVCDRILRHIGMSDFFPAEHRFTFSTAGRLPVSKEERLQFIKPGEKGFRHILNFHRANPERTLMIGDSEVSDIIPARRLGLKTFHVTSRASFYSLPDWLGL